MTLHPRASVRARESGFTLIELTIALAIVVVAMGLIVIRISGWTPRQSLRASARALGNTIILFREKAELEEEAFTVRFDEDSYQVEHREATGEPKVIRRAHLGAGEVFEPSPLTPVLLSSRGILPTLRIVIRNRESNSVTLHVGTTVNEVEYQESR